MLTLPASMIGRPTFANALLPQKLSLGARNFGPALGVTVPEPSLLRVDDIVE